MSPIIALLGVPLVLFACASADGKQPGNLDTSSAVGVTAKVYKSRGSIQCGSRGTAPAGMSRDLVVAGISVLSYTCGTDGRIYPAVCGAATGEINIFEIPAAQQNQAAALSFQPLSNLPQASQIACR